MTRDECIGVIGAGNWGTTLAKVLGDNDKRTLLWARRDDLCREINETRQNSKYLPGFSLGPSVEATSDLERICKSTSLLIAVVPSHTMRETARELGNHVNGEHVIVHATKGRSAAHRTLEPEAALERLAAKIDGAHATIQIGGHATTGLGYCTVRLA